MKLTFFVEPFTLNLRSPFVIAHGTSTVRRNVLVSLGSGFADLDGNLEISNDPWSGVQIQHGYLLLPSAPGPGVRPYLLPATGGI